MLNVKRAAPDQIAAQLLDGNLDGAVAVGLGVGLAPAVDAFISFHFDKEPVLAGARVDEKGLDIGNFHGSSKEQRGMHSKGSRQADVMPEALTHNHVTPEALTYDVSV